MSAAKSAEKLQEALDLLSDLEKRREAILHSPQRYGKVVSLDAKQVEQVIDGAHDAAIAHLFRCMIDFNTAVTTDANQSQGS
jgi:hypothetical protein